MSNINRQNSLLAAEDWKTIYQGMSRAEFKSYDLENLNRIMMAYIREKFPEHFNDYTQSSEYLALINMISFIGQNLAYRQDLNARENILELADRRDSVLRWAKVLCYRVKRNKPASGLLKINSVSTTENVSDSSGRSLSGQTTVWNDPTNSNWYEHFITIINAALPSTAKIGNPEDTASFGGLKCDQYRFNGTNTQVPVFPFSRAVGGRTMNFEVVSTVFRGKTTFYEESPRAGKNMAFVYTNDGRGSASSNTGFFLMFKQGTLQNGSFSISTPVPNNKVDISASNINDDDVWVYSTDSFGRESDEWHRVIPAHGQTAVYNDGAKSGKTFVDETRTNDQITLTFPDGLFGDIPSGDMKVYYRVSNGLSYSVQPSEMTSILMTIPYVSGRNTTETLTLSLSLKTVVGNSVGSESSESIKTNAPATYYTQNRMVSGEDYNIYPPSIDQEIIKAKSINRVSAGVSRYFDLQKTSSLHSSTNMIGKDGILYLDETVKTATLKEGDYPIYGNFINGELTNMLKAIAVRDLYFRSYLEWLDSQNEAGVVQAWSGCVFNVVSNTGQATGYITSASGSIKKVGSGSSSITSIDLTSVIKIQYGIGLYTWVKITRIYNSGLGASSSSGGFLTPDTGAIFLNDRLPALRDGLSSYQIVGVVPKFNSSFDDIIKTRIVSNLESRANFGIGYNYQNGSWVIIDTSNMNYVKKYNVIQDNSKTNNDSSWIVSFEYTGEAFMVNARGIRYVFESKADVRFFYDKGKRAYDSNTRKIINDVVTILAVNAKTTVDSNPLGYDVAMDVVDDVTGLDGYVDDNRITVTGIDTDQDGIIDNPTFYDDIIGASDAVFWEKVTVDGYPMFRPYIPTQPITVVFSEADMETCQTEKCFYDGTVYTKKTTNNVTVWEIDKNIIGKNGRKDLMFHYVHTTDSGARVDPSPGNIIDVYILTKSYDSEYRKWLSGYSDIEPTAPSSDSLYIRFNDAMSRVKAISDELIYHPARLIPIFGSKSIPALQSSFLVVKNPRSLLSDNDVKVGVLTAINDMFATGNWDFGETFHMGELVAYIIKKLSPDISNVVIVPKQSNMVFGSLFEIKAKPNEILISSATIDDISIVTDVVANITTSKAAVF